MNYKENKNANYTQASNNDNSSLNGLKQNNKEFFRILNKKQAINNKILINNKLLNSSDNKKNRYIKSKLEKEKIIYSGDEEITYKSNSCRKGNVFCFLYLNNYPIFTLGPQFYYPAIIASFNNALFFLLIKSIYIRINNVLKYISFFFLILVDITQLYTVFINPGFPEKKWFLSSKIINIIMKDEEVYKEFNAKKYKICRKCNLLIDKFLKIIHCDICDICCEYYDHHCQWIGKCIGKNNYFSFKVYVISNILYIILQIIILFIYINKNN